MATEYKEWSQRMPSTMGNAAIAGAIAAEDEKAQRRDGGAEVDGNGGQPPSAAQAATPSHDPSDGRHATQSDERSAHDSA